MTAAHTIDAEAGAYRIAPGRGVSGARPLLAPGRLAQVLRGRGLGVAVEMVAGLFTLCGHAHRHAAARAVASAADGRATDESSASLVLETARDHLRTIALEWPQRLVPTAAPVSLDWLRGSPVRIARLSGASEPSAVEQLAAFSAWLEDAVLQQSAAGWLAAHADASALAGWCDAAAARLPPAACLAAMRPFLAAWKPPAHCFVLAAEGSQREDQLRELGAALAADPLFVQQPTWRGAPAENGPWARRRHPGAAAWLAESAWTRFAARWIELVALAAAARDGTWPDVLRCGAVPLGERSALGWCEMARGTLVHRVQLEPDHSIRDWLVLAPTEWNFHPQGSLARCVERLPAGDAATGAALAAAFDPCVPCTVS